MSKILEVSYVKPKPNVFQDIATSHSHLTHIKNNNKKVKTTTKKTHENNLFSIFSSCHICTAGDDHQALIWDIQQMPRAIEDPILAYTAAEGEVNQIQWGQLQPDWIAICFNKSCEILRV